MLLPSKLANMLASGRPVIAGAEPGTGLAAAVAGCGLVVEPDSPEAIAAAIVDLVNDSAFHADCSKQARLRSVQDWSKAQIIFDLEQALVQMSGTGKMSPASAASEF